jgi:hypothetical protein
MVEAHQSRPTLAAPTEALEPPTPFFFPMVVEVLGGRSNGEKELRRKMSNEEA